MAYWIEGRTFTGAGIETGRAPAQTRSAYSRTFTGAGIETRSP